MNRYYYYLIFHNMLMNVLAFVPTILIKQRYDGAVMAMILSVAIGTALILLFSFQLRKLPGMGLPEMAERMLPFGLDRIMNVSFAAIYYTAGMMTMLVFADYTIRFVNPDLNNYQVIGVFFILVGLICRFPSDRVLYFLEIVLVCSAPLIAFILIKAALNPFLRWDSVVSVMQFVWKTPSYSALAAASYVFTGYANMAVFNRLFHKLDCRWLWGVPIIGGSILITSVFIPIGQLGSDGVEAFVYPWMTTADSMRIELGFVERVLFIFYILYGGIAFVSMAVHWHVAHELVLSALLPKKATEKLRNRFSWTTVALFSGVAMLIGQYMSDQLLFRVGNWWLQIRFAAEFGLVLFVIIAARRLRRT